MIYSDSVKNIVSEFQVLRVTYLHLKTSLINSIYYLLYDCEAFVFAFLPKTEKYFHLHHLNF